MGGGTCGNYCSMRSGKSVKRLTLGKKIIEDDGRF